MSEAAGSLVLAAMEEFAVVGIHVLVVGSLVQYLRNSNNLQGKVPCGSTRSLFVGDLAGLEVVLEGKVV